MFPGRYFAAAYFAPRYFPEVGATTTISWFPGLCTQRTLTGAGM